MVCPQGLGVWWPLGWVDIKNNRRETIPKDLFLLCPQGLGVWRPGGWVDNKNNGDEKQYRPCLFILCPQGLGLWWPLASGVG